MRLTEVESKELLKQAGINVIATKLATSREEAISISQKLGLPVALKIASRILSVRVRPAGLSWV